MDQVLGTLDIPPAPKEEADDEAPQPPRPRLFKGE
jgi:ribosome-binding factor A